MIVGESPRSIFEWIYEEYKRLKLHALERVQFWGGANRATKSVLRRLIAPKNVLKMLLKVFNSGAELVELLNLFSGG